MQKGIKERKSCPDWECYRQWPASADGISKHWRGEIRKLIDQSIKAAEEINQRLPSDGKRSFSGASSERKRGAHLRGNRFVAKDRKSVPELRRSDQ